MKSIWRTGIEYNVFKEGESTRIWVNGKITVCLERVGKGCKMMVRGVGRTLKIRDSREKYKIMQRKQ